MNIPAIMAFSSSLWAGIEAPLANHLWQSTLFAATAGLLTLEFKKNRAQVRYWLWLAASVKFLIPFSLLVSAGSYLGWSKTSTATSGFTVVIEEMNQPFSAASIQAAAATVLTKFIGLLPTLLLIGWMCGCVAVLIFWWMRWRRITASIGGALPMKSGRELETLRRLEQSAGIKRQIRLIVSESALEPGVVGIFRPILLLPAGISDRLSDAQMEAIIAHELCHVRHRDNLTAAVHMLVEAIFWFHPLVWWVGARLVDERERVCDEEVLIQGSDPQVYAEGILKVCEFYLESPLVCAAGVTGSNLKKRIEVIMVHRIASKLNSGKKLLLAAIGVAAIVGPVVFGLLHPTQSRATLSDESAGGVPAGIESVMIKQNTTGEAMPPFKITSNPPGTGLGFMFSPDKFLATNAPLPALIRMAYGVESFRITGGPDWLSSKRYDVVANFHNSTGAGRSKVIMDQRRLSLQALLADRFKLVLHHQNTEAPVYALTIANGSKLHEAKPGETYANGIKLPSGQPIGAGLWTPKEGGLAGQGVSMEELAQYLSQQLGRVVVDETGLKGHYDFTLHWTGTENQAANLLTAVPKELGLALNPQIAPVDTLVIDHAEQVTEQ
jgi:bla regulator protein blaR1